MAVKQIHKMCDRLENSKQLKIDLLVFEGFIREFIGGVESDTSISVFEIKKIYHG